MIDQYIPHVSPPSLFSQKRVSIRKFPQLIFTVFFVLVLIIGLWGSRVLLSTTQDIRQQASGGNILPKEPEGVEGLVLNQVSAEIDQFMNAGAQGFLLWHYSGFHPTSGAQWFENDQFSFFRSGSLLDDEVCLLLREKGALYNNRTIGVGVNIWSLGNYQVGDHLRWLKDECGVKTVRVFAKAGQVAGMAVVADAANQAGVQLIIAIGDYSNGGGGVPQAANKQWYESGFQSQSHQGIVYQAFVQQLRTALANKNIFGYELANEPHCAGDSSAISAYTNWGRTISQILVGSGVAAPKGELGVIGGGGGTVSSAVTSVPLIGFGQMASQQTTRCDSPSPGDFVTTNSIPEITMASAHYYNESEKNSALQAAQQAVGMNPSKVFYIGEAKAFDPTSLPVPEARYWLVGEVLDLDAGQLVYPPVISCSNGIKKDFRISCASAACIQHIWRCGGSGAQLALRTNPGANTIALSQLPQGYECVGWKLIEGGTGNVLSSGNGCNAQVDLPAADWQRRLSFEVRPEASDWVIGTTVICPDGTAPRNYPHKAEWVTQTGASSPSNWQSSIFGTGTQEHIIRATGQNQAGYIRVVDQQGNYLQPVSAFMHEYFTFGQMFSPARWTAKWAANTPERSHFIVFRPAPSLVSTVCTDPTITWNVTVVAECPNGTMPSQQVKAIYALWPPNPLQWSSTTWFVGSKQIQIHSQHSVNSVYVALYAGGYGYLQPKTPMPHGGMIASQSFSPPTWLAKWHRTAVPGGNYILKYQAPTSWCSGGSFQQGSLTNPVLPRE